jgi:hypothetical protein
MTTLAFSRDLRDFGAAGFFFGGCFIPPGVFETRLGKAAYGFFTVPGALPDGEEAAR